MIPDKAEITREEFNWLLYLIYIQGEELDRLDVAKEVLNRAEEYEKPGLNNPTFREWIKEWIISED